MTPKRIFSPETYVYDRLKNEGGYAHVKRISTAPTPDTALSGAPARVPVLVVAPLEGRNTADQSMTDAIVVEKTVVVLVLFKGKAENGAADEETVDNVIELLHGFPYDDPELQPVAFERYEATYDDACREYQLYFTTRYERRFSR
jgi:hypothetical protein